MSVEAVDTQEAVEGRARRSRAAKQAPSTSIRVSVATRDALARAAVAEGVSLTAYLEKVARRAERERILADYRACAIEAYKDPAFVAEMREWDEMDDGIDLDGDGRSESHE